MIIENRISEAFFIKYFTGRAIPGLLMYTNQVSKNIITRSNISIFVLDQKVNHAQIDIMNKGNLAIIPARGGSKRIPRKNIKDFLGKPVISYAIENALNTGLFDQVIVSTDDEEIAGIAKKYGASVPFFRSAETSGDQATTSEVLLEVMEEFKNRGQTYNYGCCIYPTAVFASTRLIRKGFDLISEYGAQSVFPVVEYSHPIGRAYKIENGKAGMIWPENLNKRTQDMEKAYHDAGQFYWYTCDILINTGKLISENANTIILEQNVVHDIDNEADWKIAEIKYRLLNG